jgi:hypothetical protein
MPPPAHIAATPMPPPQDVLDFGGSDALAAPDDGVVGVSLDEQVDLSCCRCTGVNPLVTGDAADRM